MYFNKKIDIIYKSYTNQGINCINLVMDYKRKYINLKNIILVLKQFINNSNLNDTYHGGINSYGLILLIVSFFQFNSKINDCNNLGIILIEFINFVINLDYKNYYICPYYKEFRSPLIEKKNITEQIELIDPLQTTNNVLKSCFKYETIESLFRMGLFKLFENNNNLLISFFNTAKKFKIFNKLY